MGDAQTREFEELRQARHRRARNIVVFGALAAAALAALLILQTVFTGDRAARRDPAETAALPPVTAGACSPEDEASGECNTREQFLVEMKRYQQEIKPRLDEVSLSVWAQSDYEAIAGLERQALRSFDDGKYDSAHGHIANTIALANEQLQRAAGLFDSSLELAISSFENGDVDGASQAIDTALLVDPEDETARSYRARIDVLPSVLELLEQAAVARAENRQGVELSVLQKILQLDPQREDVAARSAQLRAQYRELQYADLVRQAEQALDSGNAGSARAYVEQARKLAPSRGLGFLLSRLEALERQILLDQALARADTARSAENWQAALAAYNDALRVDSTDSRAVGGRNTASGVLGGMNELGRYLEQPLRLGSASVAAAAQKHLDEFAGLRASSVRLAGLMDELAHYLQQAKVPVDVSVVSDGKTEVQVRRVGVVGKHRQKTIQLTPGEYQFEGRRQGYKSTIVAVQVPFGAKKVEVRVECVERI